MLNFLKRITTNNVSKDYDNLVDAFIDTQQALHKLPELSDVEKVELEHTNAISHLYHSSKIEGTNLTEKRLEKAIAN
jgi:hypothetical protein